jgi:zinc and cadmium transporter
LENLVTYISLFGAVLFGGSIVFFLRPDADKGLKLLLAFSGAFLLAVSVLHLIPEVYGSVTVERIGLFVLAGFVLQLILEYFSEGIEHGHIHVHNHGGVSFPVMIMVSLCLHSFLEGMPLEREVHVGHDHGHDHSDYSLLMGIVLHKIPVAIALTTLLIKSGLSRGKTVLWLMVFACMAPLGTLVSHFCNDALTAQWAGFFDMTLAVVVGMFLHISTTILFESVEGHRFNLLKFLTILVGVGIAILTI